MQALFLSPTPNLLFPTAAIKGNNADLRFIPISCVNRVKKIIYIVKTTSEPIYPDTGGVLIDMMHILITILQLATGFFWSAAYILIIIQGFRDEASGMPMAAICANISWEFIFLFVYPHNGLQGIINPVWFTLDVVIAVQYLKYGRKEFFKAVSRKFFYTLFLLTAVLCFSVIIASVGEFKDFEGKYAAFSQNLMMSILFVLLLLKRRNTKGQSINIAVFKMIGSLLPGLVFSFYFRSVLIAVLSAAILFFDLIYAVLLNNKLIEEGERSLGDFGKHRRILG